MKPLQLTAVQFHRSMTTGRNRPLLLGCEDTAGKSYEVVVKLRGREMSTTAQLVEVVAAQLAADLGLDVPQAAVVDVPTGFESIVPPGEVAAAVQTGLGLNFGSIHLGTSFTTWPRDRTPHGHQKDQAAEIFAFDTLVQNPDRKADNPNLWARSDRLGVYDHEQAFTFLTYTILGGTPKPWEMNDHLSQSFDFLRKHIFYAPLRGTIFHLEDFEDRLGNLTDEQIAEYFTSIPLGWREDNNLCNQIAGYLAEARLERGKLLSFVKHLLR